MTSPIRHVDKVLLPEWLHPERTRYLTNEQTETEKETGKCVVYWMQRDVRTADNWALLYATHLAQTAKVPLQVMYCLPTPPAAVSDDNDDDGNDKRLPPKIMITTPMTQRYGDFLLGGLEKVHQELQQVDVPLHVIQPNSTATTAASAAAAATAALDWLDGCQPRAVVCDFSPLRYHRAVLEGDESASSGLSSRQIPLIQIDAHNVIPVWHASPKREVGARTLRPKLNKCLPVFLSTNFPKFEGNRHLTGENRSRKPPTTTFERKQHEDYLQWDTSVQPVAWAQPGSDNAWNRFEAFTGAGLRSFHELRNDPNHREICSNLSPWLNHGHISFQRIAQRVKALNKFANGTAAFVEEGLVRRELSDNYVFYANENYDALEGAAEWAQETLQNHSTDEREWLFSLEELESGKTHDDLWNAAEMQLVQEGKLHGFLRMYWAKKILEWTESPEVALRTAQYLNDKYALDGNDPNGFVGVGWSIMGIHDMGWKERPVFGKIRYMNYAGCRRKFKVDTFVNRYPGAASNAIQAAQKYGKPRETGKAPPKKRTTAATTTTATKAKKGKR